MVFTETKTKFVIGLKKKLTKKKYDKDCNRKASEWVDHCNSVKGPQHKV